MCGFKSHQGWSVEHVFFLFLLEKYLYSFYDLSRRVCVCVCVWVQVPPGVVRRARCFFSLFISLIVSRCACVCVWVQVPPAVELFFLFLLEKYISTHFMIFLAVCVCVCVCEGVSDTGVSARN